MTLADLKINQTAKVLSIDVDRDTKRHLMDIGLTKGCSITVKNLAPFGDPIQVDIRGSEFSINKDDASKIQIEI